MKLKRKPSKIGKLLIEEGYVTEEDINRALEIQAEEAEAANVLLGIALVYKGFITKKQRKTLLEHPQIRKNIGTKEFIINSYHEICQQFNCNRVAYFIEPWKGNVEIFASPESSQKE